jgi:ComF family protein
LFTRLAYHAAGLVLDQLLPPRCGVCGRLGGLLCGDCAEALPPVAGPRCDRCWQVVHGGICPHCAEYGHECTAIRACYGYSGGAQRLVTAVKYAGLHALTGPMSVHMAQTWATYGFDVDQVIPVPLHQRRERERGFNQAERLARGAAAALSLPCNSSTLVRRRPTSPQARVGGPSNRRSNVYGASACRDAAVAGARVLLIDDVTTTGATLRSCATALSDGGAAAVYGYAFAIAH